jgi:SAM-dependent methyltransferase
MLCFDDTASAQAWTHARQRLHPVLSDVRRHVADRLGYLVGRRARLLDMGGGAALLGEVVLARLADAAYVWIDPSAEMRSLAEARLAHRPDCFFRTAPLVEGLRGIEPGAGFDAAWSLDVFSARQPKDAPADVHREVFARLAPGGRYFVCEPYAGAASAAGAAAAGGTGEAGADAEEKLETVDAQEQAIAAAGFEVAASLTLVGAIAVHEMVRPR